MGHHHRRTNAADKRQEPNVRLCDVPGCDERHSARGYCRRHYRHFILGQTPRPQSKEQMRADETDSRHGTLNGYINCRCRCEKCTAAQARSMKAYLDADPERRQRWNERQLARLHSNTNAADKRQHRNGAT